jgi:formylmethanofuran dehydrogenase subunit A
MLVRNCSCLDPLHNVRFESKDLLIDEGMFRPLRDGNAEDTKEIDAGGRIVVPGGILPSFKIPVTAMYGLALDPVASARALIETGFTTVIVDGITPFTALDTHQHLQRLPVVNKVPIIDVANFQFLTGFLKSGVTNYAAAVAGSLLAKFKGYGISCIGPGSTLAWSSSRLAGTRSIREPVPFLGTTIEKVIAELAAIHGHGTFKPGILVETGIEGMPGSREQLDSLLAKITGSGKTGGTTPLVAMKQLSRNALDPAYKGGDIAENVSAILAAMKDACSIAGVVDIPSLEFATTVFMDNAASPLHDARHLHARGIIEGELFVMAYSMKERDQQSLATRYWLSGMKLVLDMPVNLKERVGFSLMPQLISAPANIASAMACFLSERYRRSKKMHFHDAAMQSVAGDLLEGKMLTLPELMAFTRAAPARMFGLEKILGGLGDGQLGDAIILNARPGDLDRLRDEPDRLHDLLCKPHAVIKGGRFALKNGQMDVQIRGHTIVHEARVDPSIADSIEQNLDKQFLKYYSTHLDAKIVPASLVEPAIKD